MERKGKKAKADKKVQVKIIMENKILNGIKKQ